MSEMKGISGGLPKTGPYNSAGSKGVQQMYKRIVVSASKKRPQKQSQPHVVVTRIRGEAAESDLPPQLNTIKRLAKEMNGCAADLNMARGEAESDEVGWLGRQMANYQLSSSPGYASRLSKAAARKVDYKADQKVFTSLANISVASTSSDVGFVGLTWKKTSAPKRDPELKPENYMAPYQGQDFIYRPQSKDAVLELVKPCQRPPRKPLRIPDHVMLTKDPE